MKTNHNNLAQDRGSKHKTYSSSSHKVCFCVFGFLLLGFCCLSADVSAKMPSEQLDPLNLLMFHSARLSQDVTAPVISMWVAKLQQTLPELSKTEAPVLWVWEPSDTAAVYFAAQVDQNLPRSSFSSTADPNKRLVDPNQDKEPFADLSFPETTQDTAGSNLKRQLWQAQISAPIIEEDKETKDELQQIIEQIYAIEFKPQKETSKAFIAVEPAPKSEPNETSTVTEGLEQSAQTEAPPKLPYEPVTEQTLQMLRSLLHHPEQLNNPLELGEVLFLSGHLKEATAAYKEALKRKSPDEPGPAQDRAWILFQIGSCLRNDDLPTSAKIYSQLIREYPDSPWSDLAKAQYKLIDWYMKDKPRALIAESQF